MTELTPEQQAEQAAAREQEAKALAEAALCSKDGIALVAFILSHVKFGLAGTFCPTPFEQGQKSIGELLLNAQASLSPQIAAKTLEHFNAYHR